MTPIFFTTPAAFRKWLMKNHQKEKELIVGFYKIGSGKKSMKWSAAVDQALCFGWIDGIRKSIDEESYCNRFTPRKASSNWSTININKIEALREAGQLEPAGEKAFALRTENKTRVYYNESETVELSAKYKKQFKGNKPAWKFFDAQSPAYKKRITHWITTAKQEKTRQARLELTIQVSGEGRRMA